MCYITHSFTHTTYLPTKTQTTFNIAFSFLNNVGLTRNNEFSFSNNDLKASNSNFILPGFSSKRHFLCTSLIITAGLILCCVTSSSCWAKNSRCCTTQLHCKNQNPLYQAPYTKTLIYKPVLSLEILLHCYLTQSIYAAFDKSNYTKPQTAFILLPHRQSLFSSFRFHTNPISPYFTIQPINPATPTISPADSTSWQANLIISKTTPPLKSACYNLFKASFKII